MSSDTAVRIGVVAVVVLVALSGAFLAPLVTSRRTERIALDLSGLAGSVLLFTDRSCPSCDRLRAMLSAEQTAFDEVVYEDDPERWRQIGVGAVPLLVVRNRRDAPRVIAGVPTRRRLRRALQRGE